MFGLSGEGAGVKHTEDTGILINHTIKTTIMCMWAVDGQLHIFSIWDKYNCLNKCPNGKVCSKRKKTKKI